MVTQGTVLGIAPLTPEWFNYKRPRLGATDVAALLGYSTYKSPLDVWARVTGKLTETSEAEGFHLKRGRYLESACAAWYADETDRYTTETPGAVQDAEFDWLMSTPDAGVSEKTDTPNGDGALECKAPGPFKAREWDWDVHLQFKIQLMMQLRTWGREWGSVAAMLYDDFVWKDLERNERFLDATLAFVLDWREKYWLKDIEPPARPGNEKLLQELHPKSQKTYIVLPNSLAAAAEELVEVKATIKEATKRKEEIEIAVKQTMGDHEFAQVGAGDYFKYATEQRTHKAREAFTQEFRVLRRTKRMPGLSRGELPEVVHLPKGYEVLAGALDDAKGSVPRG